MYEHGYNVGEKSFRIEIFLIWNRVCNTFVVMIACIVFHMNSHGAHTKMKNSSYIQVLELLLPVHYRIFQQKSTYEQRCHLRWTRKLKMWQASEMLFENRFRFFSVNAMCFRRSCCIFNEHECTLAVKFFYRWYYIECSNRL